MTPTYRLALANLGTSGLGTETVADILTDGGTIRADAALVYGKALNGPGFLEFTLPIDGSAGLGTTDLEQVVGRREVHLYRDDTVASGGEVLVWAGRLWAAQLDRVWVRFQCEGWLSYFRRREIGIDVSLNAEQFDIAWSLISGAQAATGGNIGVTRGTETPSGIVRQITYCAEERNNVVDVLEDLSGADDGFDFEITPEKVWEVYHPSQGSDLSASVVLDAAVDVSVMSWTIDASNISNSVAAIGKVIDCEPIHYTTTVDTASRSAYGLLESTIIRPDLDTDAALLDALAAEQLRTAKTPLYQPQVEYSLELGGPDPVAGDYGIGDIIGLQGSLGFATIDRPFRVIGWRMNVTTMGQEKVQLDLDGAV